MAGKKKRPEPPRPVCLCGSPAVFQVQIQVQELVLERDDCRGGPHWTTRYRTGTTIETVMCQPCQSANVQIHVTASANVEKGKTTP